MQEIIKWLTTSDIASTLNYVLIILYPFLMVLNFIGWYFKRPIYYKINNSEYYESVVIATSITYTMGAVLTVIGLGQGDNLNFMLCTFVMICIPTLIVILSNIVWKKMLFARNKIPEA